MNNSSNQKSDKAKIITEKRRVGNLGEDIGCIYLQKNGYNIVDRNYLRKYGELDIVAVKDSVYHFVEVKSVTHETKGEYRPEENVHPWKLKRLARTIQAYLLDKKINTDWQLDVMTVVLNMKTRRARVELMENIVI